MAKKHLNIVPLFQFILGNPGGSSAICYHNPTFARLPSNNPLLADPAIVSQNKKLSSSQLHVISEFSGRKKSRKSSPKSTSSAGNGPQLGVSSVKLTKIQE